MIEINLIGDHGIKPKKGFANYNKNKQEEMIFGLVILVLFLMVIAAVMAPIVKDLVSSETAYAQQDPVEVVEPYLLTTSGEVSWQGKKFRFSDINFLDYGKTVDIIEEGTGKRHRFTGPVHVVYD